MNKNLTLRMGVCNHRKYIPRLIELVRTRAIDPAQVLTQHGPIESAVEAYQAFDTRKQGWIKVKLEPETKKAA
jgi:threonine dehydrogenase-like Zn-dependent dehydrogenase